ncbi:MAG: L-fucose/L-arabinose isomerase family protein [Sedimentisphaerales bacterium]|nr:L-fucose/L-arabinose isomerase family protein [Sedimentisphaerales bacterium]MBN2843457.1 L-fucose/L-arabinose isomerase family protein [Sedimentisphaerales bacterium]
MKASIKVGLFGIGLDTYWGQFEGLHDTLMAYQDQIAAKIADHSVEVVNAGMIDNPSKAAGAAELFKVKQVEIIFLYISTYALSSTVLPVVQKANVPVIVLNIQPVAAIDYEAFNALADRGKMTGQWLANCQSCSVPEIACVFSRAGIDYHLVTGYMQQEGVWEEIYNWVDAAKVRQVMADNRVGILGHYYCGMLDVYSDLTQQSSVFGSHFELVEMCKLHEFRQRVTLDQIKRKMREFSERFLVSEECQRVELERAAQTSCALDELVAEYDLGSMAYYYEGTGGNEYENIVTSLIAGNTLLTGRNIPVAGECEVKNVQAMKIVDAFGAGGSFSEFYAVDYNDDIVMLGHDGPAHLAIAEGPVGLVPLPLFHGKPGNGLSIQMTVRHGPVTILSVVQDGQGKVKLLLAQGSCVPGPTLQIGNTNSRYKFNISAKDFINSWSMAGPAHHCAIGVGHIADKIHKLARLLKIESMQIC